jgi:L-asparaginase II
MDNPVLAEVMRGGLVESRHRGAFVVARADGSVLASTGDIETPVYPRSAIKAFQALPLVASGAADAAGFTEANIALACASHGGEAEHVSCAETMLESMGLAEGDLECGAHWPFWPKASRDLGVAGRTPSALHNNCSGKHVGMLALAQHLGAPSLGYTNRDHPVQQTIAQSMASVCEYDVAQAVWERDGCSVPTWAIPLHNLAQGFARFCTAGALTGAEAGAAQRILASAAAHPYLVQGTRRFCTGMMRRVPRVFVKNGAEGVFCACVPHLGLGIALKCDDGADRAAEAAMAGILECLGGFSDQERDVFKAFGVRPVKNRREFVTGEIRPSSPAFDGLRVAGV